MQYNIFQAGDLIQLTGEGWKIGYYHYSKIAMIAGRHDWRGRFSHYSIIVQGTGIIFDASFTKHHSATLLHRKQK